ncbi:MAG: DNA repair protein RadC [Bacteroidales bacterium]|nr:DNA repair protein RadC [Bacteroidales bacterium]
MSLKEWADEDKPREKMLEKGKKSLSNAELIAILLRSGVTGKSAVDVAKEVLTVAGNSLTTLSQLDYKRLASIKGLGMAKAATLMAALELGWRMQSELDGSKELIINDSNDLFRYMTPLLANLDHEEFWAVYLSNRKKVLGRQRIAMGGQTGTYVDPRVLFRGALECKAVMMAVVHNHPSGSLRPSQEDKALTTQLVSAGKLMQINVIEHLIIGIASSGKAEYFSFKGNGLI